jgi:hypothetical protein
MEPGRMIRTRVLILVVIALASVAAAQGIYPPPPQTGDLTLTGTVINSVTGEGISRALVTMSGMQPRSTLTDSAGKFQFDNLPEMQAFVTARKPGFFSDQELTRRNSLNRMSGITPIQVKSGMGAVTVTLMPAGVITGHVTTVDGDPVEATFVHLKVSTIQQGRKQLVEQGGGQTDEDGAFRIANLQPGKYYLFTDGAARAMGVQDATFAPTYYPGVADISAAAPIQVQPGQTIVADLALQKEKAYRVSGVVTGLPPGQSAMIQIVGSGGDALPFGNMARAGDGSFELRGVPPGAYTLKAISQVGMGFFARRGGGRPPSAPPQSYTGSIPINVSTDLSGITVPLQPSANIPVIEKTEFTSAETNNAGAMFTNGNSGRTYRQYLQVMLRRVGEQNSFGAQTGPNGEIVLRGIEPGRYRAEFYPMGGNVYVQSASFGNTDLLHDDLIISSGGDQQPIDVVLRDDAASVSGTVNCGNVQCSVLLLPDNVSSFSPRQVFVSPTGVFQIAGLPPGGYHVYAFDRLDGIEYTNPDVMKSYDSTAEAVTLTAGQKTQIDLQLTKVGDQ